MKYVDAKVVFQEVPDEITLAISISNCNIHCKGCHSQYLWNDVGVELTKESLDTLVRDHIGVTCVCFMGGEENDVESLSDYIRQNYPDLKTAWYTGQEDVEYSALKTFDYIKVGPYKEECGGLDNPNTNQRMYKVINRETLEFNDITKTFYETENKD